MPVPSELTKLIEHFRRNLPDYLSLGYKEAEVRREFVDPFFELLGWDVQNRGKNAEAYKDVVHEDSIKVGGMTKAPDYAFRVGGSKKFFVETKKPRVVVKEDPDPAYQLRRYAWSAHMPLSLLTDFQEFAVYDCRVKPNLKDKASMARTFYCTYEEYPEHWDFISGTFSKEAVHKGHFDRYAGETKQKRGTAEVDDAFLKEIESWRDLLARNFALRNPDLTTEGLNFAVQKTIDRLVFLRICEDRGIERYGQLQALLNGGRIYPRLMELFQHADLRYNSGLFHFHREKGEGESPDELTPSLEVDDAALKDILRRLYYPESPYEFSVLPAEILGQVYEQFLGKVIRLTSGHQAKVEEKPEVRKAGGVYYTPSYIVDYIVKNTVGKLLEGKTPKGAAKLKVLDPACGSGSFLLGAYQHLLDWHLDWYVAHDPKKHAKGKDSAVVQTPQGEWRLTTPEKKCILLNNIHGVDIDPQAVEVTKLSLLLKVLEGETGETLHMFRTRVLPDLGNNIKCGNSLIGPDIQMELGSGFQPDPNVRKRGQVSDLTQGFGINSFDWRHEFPSVFPSPLEGEGRERGGREYPLPPGGGGQGRGGMGGFDAVIGNPPYVRIQTMKESTPHQAEFLKKAYKSAGKGNYDLYVVFVEKGLSLLNPNGLLGYILPHKFFNAQYGEGLRKLIAEEKRMSQIVHFGDQQVFDGASTYTCLMFLAGSPQRNFRFTSVEDLDGWRVSGKGHSAIFSQADVTGGHWNFLAGEGGGLLRRMKNYPLKLDKVTRRIFQGLKTSADKIYIVEEVERKGKRTKVYSPQLEKEVWLENGLLHPLIKGGDSRRFHLAETRRLILFPYLKRSEEKSTLAAKEELEGDFPLTWAYLQENKDYLQNREDGKMKGAGWYGYIYPKALDVMPLPKIFTPDIAPRASFSLDETGEVFFTGGAAGGYGILLEEGWSQKYLLGLLNSRLLDWIIKKTATRMRGGWYSFESRYIKNLPIRSINFNNPKDKSRNDHMVKLVDRMLDLNRQLAAATVPTEKDRLQRDLSATDRMIDALAYELYELTPEEIRIVEEE